jgi:hypothetical protein
MSRSNRSRRVFAATLAIVAGCLWGIAAAAAPIVGTARTVVRDVRGELASDIRTINVNNEIFLNEDISTGPGSAARIVFLDGTVLSLAEDSRLKLTTLVFDPDPAKSKVAVKAVKGAFKWVSGKLPTDAYRIETPVATVGIRGTIIEFAVEGTGTTFIRVNEGLATVMNLRRESLTLRPGESAIVRAPEPEEVEPPPLRLDAFPAALAERFRRLVISIVVNEAAPPSPAGAGSGGTGPTGAAATGTAPSGFGSEAQAGSTNAPSPPVQPSNRRREVVFTPAAPAAQPPPPEPPPPQPPAPEPPPVAKNVITVVQPTPTQTRVGTARRGTVTVSRQGPGDGSLVGTVGRAGGGTVSIAVDERVSFDFDVSPTKRGTTVVIVPFDFVDTGAGAASPTLEGTLELMVEGVGPVFGADAEEIAFGGVAAGETRERVLRLFNLTTDAGPPDLVGLTLLDAVIEGLAKDLFTLSGFLPGTVLGPGGFVDLVITFTAPWMFGFFDDAVLVIATDQGVPFCLGPVGACQRGESFTLALSGASVAAPGPLALLLPLAALWWLAAPRRRAADRRSSPRH